MSLVNRVQTVLKNRLKKKPVSSRAAIVVHGLEGVATKLAKCCNPLPGEEIIGFVTDEQHVSVHSATCPNVSNIMHKEKQIPVTWSLPPGLQKAVRMKVEMIYREGALRDITKVLADARVAIEQFEQLPTKDGLLKIQFVVGFNNDTQRSQLYSRLQRVSGVHTVE
jgi:GTP pyrophosphokinase